MEQVNLEDRDKGYIRAKVESSSLLPTGILVDINDHYELGPPDDAVGCEDAVTIVATGFEPSIVRSAWIIDQVMALAE
jgi:hypothetical protein